MKDLVRASGGRTPDVSATYSSSASLVADDVREISSLSEDEVRSAVREALGAENASHVDDVVGALRTAVGNEVRSQVRERTERALQSRLGELRTARHDDAKMARVLGRIGDVQDPASRELQLAALGVEDPRGAASLLRRSDVQTALANGTLPEAARDVASSIRSEESMERTEAMFEGALETAGRDPFLFSEARDEVRGELGGSAGSFVRQAIVEAREDDGHHRTIDACASKLSDFAASALGGGPTGAVAFGIVEVAVAQGAAGTQMAGLLAGVSSTEEAREAIVESRAVVGAAVLGFVAGEALHPFLPHSWLGNLAGAVIEVGVATGAEHAEVHVQRHVVRP